MDDKGEDDAIAVFLNAKADAKAQELKIEVELNAEEEAGDVEQEWHKPVAVVAVVPALLFDVGQASTLLLGWGAGNVPRVKPVTFEALWDYKSVDPLRLVQQLRNSVADRELANQVHTLNQFLGRFTTFESLPELSRCLS